MFCWSLKTSVKSKKKVFTFANVLFSFENIGEEQKKKVFTSADVLFFPENIGEEQKKKVFTSEDALQKK